MFVDVFGYEEIYQIDENGVVQKKHNLGKNGYCNVTLRNKGNDKKCNIHSLLAIHFIPNDNNLPFVDHINRDKSDNRLENLRWASISENNINKSRKGCISIDKRTINGKTYEYFRAFYTPANEKRAVKGLKQKLRLKLISKILQSQ